MLGIEVGRVGVLADVHGGELAGALAVGRIGRIGDAEVVEHLIALAHVEPVGIEGDVEVPVLVAQLRHVHGMPRLVVGQLALFAVEPGDRIPFPLGNVEEALVAAQGVEHGAHGAAFVGVVHVEEMVHPTVGAGIALRGNVARGLQEAEQATLQQRPLGRGEDVGTNDGRHGSHFSPFLCLIEREWRFSPKGGPHLISNSRYYRSKPSLKKAGRENSAIRFSR